MLESGDITHDRGCRTCTKVEVSSTALVTSDAMKPPSTPSEETHNYGCSSFY